MVCSISLMEGTCGMCILSMMKLFGMGCVSYCCDIISVCFCIIICGMSLRYWDMVCIVCECVVGGGGGGCVGGGDG